MNAGVPTVEPLHKGKDYLRYRVVFSQQDVTTVTLTSKAAVARRWVRDTRRRGTDLIVGVGAQWGNDGPLQLLVLCVGDRCLMFRVVHCDRIPNKLRRFLKKRSAIFVAYWGSRLQRKLRGYELGIKKLVDLQKIQKKKSANTFESLVEKTLGQRPMLRPEISKGDWSSSTLSLDQIGHASMKPYFNYKMVVEEKV